MVSEQNQIRRPVAVAGLRKKQFVGYAVLTNEGWTCVVTVGNSWSKIPCRNADEARTHLKSMARAADLHWYPDLLELEKLLESLPEHDRPWILPDAILGEFQRSQKIRPAATNSMARLSPV